MDPQRAVDFISRNHRAVLATRRADGGLQMSPITLGIDASGHPVISSRETAYKVRNLRRDPHVVICCLSDAFYGEWLYVEGDVEIVALPEAMELLVDYYRRISGEHPDWDDYRAAMEREQRVLLRVTITRAGPDREG